MNCPYPDCWRKPVIRELLTGGFAVQCSAPRCSLTGRIGKTRAEAIELWNQLRGVEPSICSNCIHEGDCDVKQDGLLQCEDYQNRISIDK